MSGRALPDVLHNLGLCFETDPSPEKDKALLQRQGLLYDPCC